MKLSKTLFTDSATAIYQIVFDHDWDNAEFGGWNLNPISAPILSADYAHNGLLDGEFIVKGARVEGPSQSEPCYLSVTMPEGVVNFTYVLDLATEQTNQKTGRGKSVISLVAIEALVDYGIFYSKEDPEVGLRVLRQGLSVARTRWPVAHSLACILRDERRYEEAIDAITVVMTEGPPELNYSNYQERARLLELVGDGEGAAKDRQRAGEILNAARE